MRAGVGRQWLTLLLAVFLVISGCAVSAEHPPTTIRSRVDPAVSIQELPPAAGVEIGRINYTPGNVVPDPFLESAIIEQLEGYDHCEEDFGKGVRYFYNAVDLNGDGAVETIVYLVGAFACGSGGCTTLIFQSKGKTHKLMSRVLLVHNPILVSDQRTNGWRNLILYVAGGGAEAAYHLLKHSGSTYPQNPSLAPRLPAGAVVTGDAYIANQIRFDTPGPVLHSAGCVAAGFELLRSEGLGEFRIDLDGEQVLKLLGEPEAKGRMLKWEADGRHHQTWQYREQGIILDMVSESAADVPKIASVQIVSPSMLKTRRGIGIGATYSDVEDAYGPEKDEENSAPPSTFVAGSPYGGLMFSFERGKVTKILLGAAAE